MQSRITPYRACAVLLLGALTACDAPEPLASLPQGETGRVVRVIDGDALVLDTGLTVRLSGIEAPAPARRNREGEPYADTSTRLLEDLVMGRQVRLIYPGITRDRYDRALAYVETDDNLGPRLWLNLELVTRGAARARLYPDTARLGNLLLAAEDTARRDQTGLWRLEAYQVHPAETLGADARGFYLVSGVPGTLETPAPEDAICARRLVGADLVIDIEAGASAFCHADLARQPYRFRGYVREGRMELTHALNAELLEE